MRTLVRDILEPVVEKNEMEGEKYLSLDKKANNIFKRLEVLEFALLGEKQNPHSHAPSSQAVLTSPS